MTIPEYEKKEFSCPKCKSKKVKRQISGIEFKSCKSVFDENGYFNPEFDENVCETFHCDTIIVAIGQSANLDGIKDQGVAISKTDH